VVEPESILVLSRLIVARSFGLNSSHQPPHVSRGMAMIPKRLLTLCLALAFLVGATVQLVPCSTTQMDMGVRADMEGGCAAPQTPCTGHMPSCIDHVGCVTVPALPPSPASMPIAFRWIVITYDFAAVSLPGLNVEPELSPPILAI
jgi:hypothetical protein